MFESFENQRRQRDQDRALRSRYLRRFLVSLGLIGIVYIGARGHANHRPDSTMSDLSATMDMPGGATESGSVHVELPGMSLLMPRTPEVHGDYRAGTAIVNGVAKVTWSVGRVSTEAEFRQQAQRALQAMSGSGDAVLDTRPAYAPSAVTLDGAPARQFYGTDMVSDKSSVTVMVRVGTCGDRIVTLVSDDVIALQVMAASFLCETALKQATVGRDDATFPEHPARSAKQHADGEASGDLRRRSGTNATTATASHAVLTPRRQHTATQLPDGRVLVAGGETRDGGTAFVFDPKTGWSKTGSMKELRVRHVAIGLADGRVLVAGGVNKRWETATSELWSPTSGRWTNAGTMPVVRQDAAGVRLAGGRALVTGGRTFGVILENAEVWNPATRAWTSVPPMTAARYDHLAFALPDGRVLVAGGTDRRGDAIASAELRAADGMWKATAPMRKARSQACGGVLDDGRVLVAGGNHNKENDLLVPIAGAELFDPKTGRWSSAGDLAHPRLNCAAVALPGGRMVVIGGYGGRAAKYLGDVELFEQGAWKTVATLATPRGGATATIAGRRLLVVGGETDDGNAVDETIALP